MFLWVEWVGRVLDNLCLGMGLEEKTENQGTLNCYLVKCALGLSVIWGGEGVVKDGSEKMMGEGERGEEKRRGVQLA